MMDFYFNKLKPPILGAALLFYILTVTLIFTLAPFNYALPDMSKISEFWEFGLTDTIKNIILFIPLGFLLFPLLPEKHKYLKALLLGVSFSAFIELNQIFIPTRRPGINDILTNGIGSLAGCFGHDYAKKFIKKKTTTLLNLGIPVMNIVFMLIPLLWLSSFAAGYEVNRFWLLFLIGVMGAILVSEVYINRISERRIVYLFFFTLLFVAWYLIGVLPSFIKYPKRFAGFTIFLTLFVFLRMKFGTKSKFDKRFELKTIKKVLPIFVTYLLLLSQWPLQLPGAHFHFSLLLNFSLSQHYFLEIFRFIEYFAAVTIAGYIISEYINRSKNQRHKSIRIVIWIILTATAIEFLRGFHPSHSAILIHFIFAFLWAVFGALLYRMQLDYFKISKENGSNKLRDQQNI